MFIVMNFSNTTKFKYQFAEYNNDLDLKEFAEFKNMLGIEGTFQDALNLSQKIWSLKNEHDSLNHIKSVHIIQEIYEKGIFQWIHSKGSVDCLQQHISDFKLKNNSSMTWNEKEFLTESVNICNLISSYPGMGKTLLLKYMHNEMNKNIFGVFIRAENLNTWKKQVFQENSSIFPKPLFKGILDQMIRNGKVYIFVDGVDESPTEAVLSCIIKLKENNLKCWITTRPHIQKYLENALEVLSYDLTKFSLTDQSDFLQKYFEDEEIRLQVKERMDSIDTTKQFHDFITLPLHLKMLSDVYKNSDSTVQSLYDLYEEFYKVHITVFDVFQKYVTSQIKLIAIRLFFQESFIKSISEDLFEMNNEFIEENRTSLKKNYILNGFGYNNEGIFGHRTIAEFLAAKWLVEKILHRPGVIQYQKMWRCLHHPHLLSVKLFADLYLVQGKPLHEQILSFKNDVIEIDHLLLRHFKNVDDLNRSALDIAVSYGEIYPLPNQNLSLYLKNIPQGSDIKCSSENQLLIIEMNDTVQRNKYYISEAIVELLSSRIPVNTETVNFALMSKCLANANILLKRKFINLKMQKSELIISTYLSVYFGFYYIFNSLKRSSLKEVREICRFDYKLESKNWRLYQKHTLLHAAINSGRNQSTTVQSRIDICQNLIDLGLEVNSTDRFNYTALHLAVREGFTEVCQFLIKNGADVNATTFHRQTPLLLAALKGSTELCKILIEKGSNVNAVGLRKKATLHLAASNKNIELCSVLLSNGAGTNITDEQGLTPLHEASKNGNEKICKILIDNGADVNAIDKIGSRPLHYTDQIGICQLLIEKGASVNAVNRDGTTPLHSAAKNGNKDLCKYLIQKGSRVNAIDQEGNTALLLAAKEGFTDLCLYLIEQRADLNASDNFGYTALIQASMKADIELCKTLIERRANVNAAAKNRCTALSFAVQKGQNQLCKILLANGADVNAKLWNSSTALHLSAEMGHIEVSKTLINNRADVNATDKYGITPLFYVINKGQSELFCNLVKLGARLPLKN